MSRNRQKLHPSVAEAVLEVAEALRDGSLPQPSLVDEAPAPLEPTTTTVRRLSIEHAGRWVAISGLEEASRLKSQHGLTGPIGRAVNDAPEMLTIMGRLVGFEANASPQDGTRGLVLQSGSATRTVFVPLSEIATVSPREWS